MVVIIDTTSDTESVALLDAERIQSLTSALAHGQILLTPMQEHGAPMHFCCSCHGPHSLHGMALCQDCWEPVCEDDTVISKRVNRPIFIAHVPCFMGGLRTLQRMHVATCLKCFSHACWSQNLRFHHERVTALAPSVYAKQWRNLDTATAPDARLVFGELLGAYENLQRANSELQDRIAVLEKKQTAISLDALLDAYNKTVEKENQTASYTALDRSNGYGLFPSPCSAPLHWQQRRGLVLGS